MNSYNQVNSYDQSYAQLQVLCLKYDALYTWQFCNNGIVYFYFNQNGEFAGSRAYEYAELEQAYYEAQYQNYQSV